MQTTLEIVEERELAQQTDRTITDTDDLFETLEAVRERGIAYNEEEMIQGSLALVRRSRTSRGRCWVH